MEDIKRLRYEFLAMSDISNAAVQTLFDIGAKLSALFRKAAGLQCEHEARAPPEVNLGGKHLAQPCILLPITA